MSDKSNDIRIIRSGRKTISIEVTRDLQVIVRAPSRMSSRDINRFIADKSQWIKKHMEIMKEKLCTQEQRRNSAPSITPEQLHELADRALTEIPEKVAAFSPVVGVNYGKITIRNQVSRWGSCSSAGNLSFNCLLMLAPPEVIDYVVVHELCHLREMNHSTQFWREVERVLPGYKAPKKWLKENGTELIDRMRRYGADNLNHST